MSNNEHDPVRSSFAFARELGAEMVGTQHLFVCLLEGIPDDEAQGILNDVGLERANFEAGVARVGAGRDVNELTSHSAALSLHTTAAFSHTLGFAYGVAHTRGDVTPNSLDFLSAFFSGSTFATLPMELGLNSVTAQRVVAELERRHTPSPR